MNRTPEELVGYCDSCESWYDFMKEDVSKGHTVCGSRWSNRQGFQVTTKRSFVLRKGQAYGKEASN